MRRAFGIAPLAAIPLPPALFLEVAAYGTREMGCEAQRIMDVRAQGA
jgi:hypothetical protein